jgi:hypothetical protein
MRVMTARAEQLERNELRRFVEEVLLPCLRLDGPSSSHREIYAAAVEHVERCVKQSLSPGDIDESILNFDSYLWRQGGER